MDKKLSWNEIRLNATKFSLRWQNAKWERSQAQSFLKEFLQLFGVDIVLTEDSRFEYPIKKKDGGFKQMDFFWPKRFVVEMKSLDENLDNAYNQLKGYMELVPADDVPDLWMVSDFKNIIIWIRSAKWQKKFELKDLHKNIKRFADIAGYATERLREDQTGVNVKAAEKMAKLHDAMKSIGYDGHKLEIYLVRLLFCMFAEDTGIFHPDAFFNYVDKSKADGSDLADRLRRLFETLNMHPDIRAKQTMLSDELKRFEYINGNLFAERLETPYFDNKMRLALLDCIDFDWSAISPAIFGTMFQSVMNEKERRELGAHYTSEENILKLINPLFLDELYKEFERVKMNPIAIEHFHNKLASLKFLDPACGCGNFLIIAYRELRKLELEILKMKNNSYQLVFDVTSFIKVNVEQFYGIEYEEFPCQIARVGLWLTEHQMNLQAAVLFGHCHPRLPLQKGATVVNGNALRMDWESVVPKAELSYVLGNPPFVGYSNQSEEQKADILSVYLDAKGKPFKTAGKIDYVAAWYYKAAKLLTETQIRAAFVSTNSITQGEQVAAVWKPLFEMFSIRIDFAYRTFKWSNEAKGKAAVHCVIVGFGFAKECYAAYASRFLPRNKKIKPFSRELRNNSTRHENHLWHDFLCNFKPRFTRQRIIGNYIADFFCYKAGLVIELDGSQHYEKKAIEYDRIRTEYLNSQGIEVLRFPNKEVDINFKEVCAKIAAKVADRPLFKGGFKSNEVSQKDPFSKGGGVATSMGFESHDALQNSALKSETQVLSQIRVLQPPDYESANFSPLERGLCADLGALCIYDGDVKIVAKNINPYLIDAPNIFVESRSKPICDVPEMQKGNIPVDDGNLIIESDDIDEFLENEPRAAKYVHKLLGADEYINKKNRYCLWLVDADPTELRKMPLVMERINKCKAFRLASPKAATRKYADYPAIFMEIRQPKSPYILIPRHSSEKRRYIPFGFMDADVITTDANSTIEGATLYHFGILTSNVHMAWTRAVCGRLEMRYRYSNDVVYNNFPWVRVENEQKAEIEKLAQGVLDARAKFPESSLADLYDPLTMPPELLKAHQVLDKAVMKLYGFGKDMGEAEIVAALMEKYR